MTVTKWACAFRSFLASSAGSKFSDATTSDGVIVADDLEYGSGSEQSKHGDEDGEPVNQVSDGSQVSAGADFEWVWLSEDTEHAAGCSRRRSAASMLANRSPRFDPSAITAVRSPVDGSADAHICDVTSDQGTWPQTLEKLKWTFHLLSSASQRTVLTTLGLRRISLKKVSSFCRRMELKKWAMMVFSLFLAPCGTRHLCPSPGWDFLEQLTLASFDVGRIDIADVWSAILRHMARDSPVEM
jgi:hypothetical protein